MGVRILTDGMIVNLNEGLVKSWLEAVLPEVIGFFWSIVLAFLVYWIGRKVIKILCKIINKSMVRHNVEDGLVSFTQSILKGALNIILFVVILGLFGITTTSIAATIAALGLTAGLSLQGALTNFAGGCMILLFHPFRVGDYIIEDSTKNEGTVEALTIIYTTIRTLDGKTIQIPNGALAATSITNCSDMDKRMFNETVGISYSSDIKKAKEILFDIAEKAAFRVEEDEIKVFVAGLGESTVNIGLRFWIKNENFWATKWNTLEAIKTRFDEEGIVIAFNQLDVHIDSISDIK